MSFVKKEFIRGQYIFKQGDMANIVYFTESGDFESTVERMIKPLNFQYTNYSQFLGPNASIDKRPMAV